MDEEVVYSVGVWTVKTGKEEIFLKAWMDFANWTKSNQKGSRNVITIQDMEQKNKFMPISPWDNLESTQAWRQTPEFRAAFIKFKELCDEIGPKTMKTVVNIP